MKPHAIYNVDAPKRAVNLSANSSLVNLARQADINLSKTFEDALCDKLRKTLQEQWREQNHDAILAHNRRIEENGVFGATKRRF
jgi:antitoxin CcdA